MENNEIVDLCVLGRDRIYITLIEIENVIKYCQDNHYNDVLQMLIFKKSEIEEQKEKATKIINQIKGVKE